MEDRAQDLRIKLCEIDNGRFEDIIHAVKLTDVCQDCDSFNMSVKDQRKAYRCHCMPSCIAATLNTRLVSYLNWKLGWISQEDHMK